MREESIRTKESQKVRFKPGDIVKFKGFEPEIAKAMKVKEVVFDKTNGAILGVLVFWHNDKGDLIEKLVDSRGIYKIEFKAFYYLYETKHIFVKEGRSDLVEEVNNLMNKI